MKRRARKKRYWIPNLLQPKIYNLPTPIHFTTFNVIVLGSKEPKALASLEWKDADTGIAEVDARKMMGWAKKAIKIWSKGENKKDLTYLL